METPTVTDRGLRRAYRVSKLLGGPFVRYESQPASAATMDALRSGCILATNHRSLFDAFTGFTVLGGMHVTARPVSAAWLWEQRMVGRLLDSVGAIPVAPGKAALEAVDAAAAVLAAGEVVLVTPEGRIVPPEERVSGVGEGTKLVSRIAVQAGVPIVPAAMTGTDTFWPLDRRVPRMRPFRPVTIRFALGEPLSPSLSHRDNVTATMAAISALVAELDERAHGR